MSFFKKMSLPSFPQAKAVKPGRAVYSIGMALLLALFALPTLFGFAAAPSCEVSCTAPSSLTKTGQGSGSISYAWSGPGEATGFLVKYIRLSDGYSQESVIEGASHTFTGLSSERHQFLFATICGEEVTGFVVTEDIISN